MFLTSYCYFSTPPFTGNRRSHVAVLQEAVDVEARNAVAARWRLYLCRVQKNRRMKRKTRMERPTICLVL